MSGTSRKWLVCLAASTMLMGLAQSAVASGAEAGAGDAVEVEVVKERYPNRAIKIERHVTLDEHRNYVNHGAWTMFAPDGTLAARGVYWKGNRQGKWIRWISDVPAPKPATPPIPTLADDADQELDLPALLIGIEFEGFSKPFRSEANFVDGKLVGDWSITDADDRQICLFSFDQDQLNGAAVWYHPNGETRRQIVFDDGKLIDELKEWELDGTESLVETYINGRRQVAHSKKYDTGEKHSEGHYLYPAGSVQIHHDWWNNAFSIEISGSGAKKLKHGMWTHWFPNGGKKTEGEFDDGKPIGMHLWWYENGQLETQGEFVDGKQTGAWIWWHENGLKKTEGQIVDGRKVGLWSQWDPSGTLVAENNHGAPSRVPHLATSQPQPQPQPQVQAQPQPEPVQRVQHEEQNRAAGRWPLDRTPLRFPLKRTDSTRN